MKVFVLVIDEPEESQWHDTFVYFDFNEAVNHAVLSFGVDKEHITKHKTALVYYDEEKKNFRASIAINETEVR